jgi:hypothetical protein
VKRRSFLARLGLVSGAAVVPFAGIAVARSVTHAKPTEPATLHIDNKPPPGLVSGAAAYLYLEHGRLMFRGQHGTITTLGPA